MILQAYVFMTLHYHHFPTNDMPG